MSCDADNHAMQTKSATAAPPHSNKDLLQQTVDGKSEKVIAVHFLQKPSPATSCRNDFWLLKWNFLHSELL